MFGRNNGNKYRQNNTGTGGTGTPSANSITDAMLSATGIKATVANKIKVSNFTATVANTTHCIHNLAYTSVTDTLQVTDTYSGHICQFGTEYTENSDGISIDLVGWNIQIGEVINFVVFRNSK